MTKCKALTAANGIAMLYSLCSVEPPPKSNIQKLLFRFRASWTPIRVYFASSSPFIISKFNPNLSLISSNICFGIFCYSHSLGSDTTIFKSTLKIKLIYNLLAEWPAKSEIA